MTVFFSFILGAVQGLTEFLPVSSSGHLVLIQQLAGVELGGAEVLFDLFLHVGTLLSACIVLRKELFAFIKSPRRLAYLVIASLPAALAGFALSDIVDKLFSGMLLFAGFAVTAAMLTAAQQFYRKRSTCSPLRARSAFVMGIAQAVAIIPGISRSGATITAAALCGVQREEGVRFCFLMSIPVILGGFVLKLVQILNDGALITFTAFANPAVCAVVSVASSAAFGLVALKFTFASVAAGRFTPFIIYLCLLAVVCFGLHLYGIL